MEEKPNKIQHLCSKYIRLCSYEDDCKSKKLKLEKENFLKTMRCCPSNQWIAPIESAISTICKLSDDDGAQVFENLRSLLIKCLDECIENINEKKNQTFEKLQNI